MGKRADRRVALDRKKRKAARLYAGCRCPAKYANNLTVCSGACCGNPRKWFGDPTRQEILAPEARP